MHIPCRTRIVARCDAPTRQVVTTLYGINRPLSALAMEERYRSVSIGDLHDRETILAVRRLKYVPYPKHYILYKPPSPTFSDQTRARYVRVLNLHPATLAALLSLNKRKYWVKKTLKTLGMLPRRQTAFIIKPKSVLTIISNLSLVTSLTLDCEISTVHPTLKSYKKSLPFIAAGWASFGQNLRFLHLKVPLYAIQETIGSAKLPNLQGLSLDFALWDCAMPGSQQVIVNFIHNHADSLRFLDISMYRDLFQMLQDVRIPLLDSFKFYQYEQIDTVAFQLFLSAHSRTLKTLDLRLHTYNSDIPHENWFIIRITLPKLQSLAVKFWSRSDYHLQGAMDHVVQYSHTLVSLDVTMAPYSYNQIHGLATQFSAQGLLRKLGLTTKTLIPKLLILLSSKLPFLENLTLEFYGLAAQEGPVTVVVGHYAEEMKVVFVLIPRCINESVSVTSSAGKWAEFPFTSGKYAIWLSAP
ncbi:uncharacterized protein LACBIDRAFT_332622 [Laccaria bicolor S238N-H82]|uniref:Predicted protein n=1 Tax=Laccaria bicolor (strain S238N-H82 / ATCC MYA-4686) TaxID=486041 RepID=B0DTD5_LACBS|nr:uncharacterized protein LACBIDRAFT_332622 [Laccaria bicolor S238N-H82]EDR02092.1 predicted protein [Laccaria bicolor S238N-H82]|eukprot:XP_001887249.1 predicted protein [Laccaria bicolor S238N-H82]